ncbi:DUF3180 domain-containing protein [Kocuria palustris]|uniref:DUF3180 domain-containing protein n=1 Tax=Kocuria palustris TaxID=71999 RepID=UPI0011A010A7|nr:DUF3180 domain-containing protein [Kocuria palustris]
MRGLTVRVLATVAALAFVAAWAADLLSGRLGGPLLALPVLSGVGLLVFAGVLLIMGLRVRRLRDGDRELSMDRSWGTITAALAQAAAILGGLTLGWHAMLVVDQAVLVPLRSDQGPLWGCLFQVGVGAVLIVIGWIVERFCRIPPDDPEAEEAGQTRPGTAPEGGLARGGG